MGLCYTFCSKPVSSCNPFMCNSNKDIQTYTVFLLLNDLLQRRHHLFGTHIFKASTRSMNRVNTLTKGHLSDVNRIAWQMEDYCCIPSTRKEK